MLTADAVRYFGTQAALARALKIRPPSITDWGANVPPLRQLQLEKLTDGALRADPKIMNLPPINGSQANA